MKKKLPAPPQTRCLLCYMATPRTVRRPTPSTAICDTRPVETRQASIVNEFPPPLHGPATPDVHRLHQGIIHIRRTIKFWDSTLSTAGSADALTFKSTTMLRPFGWRTVTNEQRIKESKRRLGHPEHEGTSILCNVKFTLEQATKAERGSRGIALLFLYPRR